MKNNIKDYVLIDGTSAALLELFNNSSRNVMFTIQAAIKKFTSLSADEQKDLVNLAQERTKQIDRRITEINTGTKGEE
jgi:uncharacterized protein YjcR